MKRTIINYLGPFKRHFFECDKGNRWSECEWKNEDGYWQGKKISKDKCYCFFSGCKEHNHKITLVKTLEGNSKECLVFEKDWFRSISHEQTDQYKKYY